MKAKKRPGWGGARNGAGRPKGSGTGSSPDSRRNRVAVMVSDREIEKLERIAKRRKIPLATLAYRLLLKGLAGAR